MHLLPLLLRFLLPPQITGHVSGISLKPKTIKFEGQLETIQVSYVTPEDSTKFEIFRKYFYPVQLLKLRCVYFQNEMKTHLVLFLKSKIRSKGCFAMARKIIHFA